MPDATDGTGHGAAVSGPTPAISNVISVQQPGFTGSSVARPTLDQAVGSSVPQSGGGVLEPGVVVVTFEHDEDYVPAYYERFSLVITHPVPEALTNGATDTYANAFIRDYEQASLETGERKVSSVTIQVQGEPVKVAAS